MSASGCTARRYLAPSSPPPKQLVELALPFAVFVGGHQHRYHLLLRQQIDDAGRVRRHVLARRQPSELGEELLAFLAEHEVGGEAGGGWVGGVRGHAPLAEQQPDRTD